MKVRGLVTDKNLGQAVSRVEKSADHRKRAVASVRDKKLDDRHDTWKDKPDAGHRDFSGNFGGGSEFSDGGGLGHGGGRGR